MIKSHSPLGKPPSRLAYRTRTHAVSLSLSHMFNGAKVFQNVQTLRHPFRRKFRRCVQREGFKKCGDIRSNNVHRNNGESESIQSLRIVPRWQRRQRSHVLPECSPPSSHTLSRVIKNGPITTHVDMMIDTWTVSELFSTFCTLLSMQTRHESRKHG